MKLISKFKDYYDYMIGITGVDKKVVFYRGKINATERRFKVPTCYHSTNCIDDHHYYILSICGKRFMLIETKATTDKPKSWLSRLRLVTLRDLRNREIYNDLSSYHGSWWWRHGKKSEKDLTKLYDFLHGIYEEDLVEISKEINSPIFLIYPTGSVCDTSPVLKDIKGVSGMLDAKVLYNEICFFIGNVLTNQKPIITISNNVKIEKAGFDLKTSFRGKLKR